MPSGGTNDRANAVDVLNPQGAGSVLILCEHASNHIPDRYNGLGLDHSVKYSHVAWDPGALAMATHLSTALDAPLVASRVSRLVYDCNRPPYAPAAMPEKTERFHVPGNQSLSLSAIDERIATVYRPFCNAVMKVIADRKAAGKPTILVTIHSFTRVYFDQVRTLEIGILHDEDARLADEMLNNVHLLPHRKIERNAPYGPSDGVTHSLKIHGQAHGLFNVMLEVRNDLLSTPADERAMADEILTLLLPALATVSSEEMRRA